MAAQLERLVYCSRAQVSMESLIVIADILAVSQRNNRRDDVTGALAYADGRFMQILEGRQDALNRVLSRVQGDPRHSDLHVAYRSAVEGRLFAEWTMVAPRIAPAQKAALIEAMDHCEDRPAMAIELMRRVVTAGS